MNMKTKRIYMGFNIVYNGNIPADYIPVEDCSAYPSVIVTINHNKYTVPSSYTVFGENECVTWYKGDGSFAFVSKCCSCVICPGNITCYCDIVKVREFECFWFYICMIVQAHFFGRVIIHGSSVVLRDKVVMFIASPGAGKSTICAALAQYCGCPIISDDVSIISPNGLELFNGGRLITLNNDSVSFLGLENCCDTRMEYSIYGGHKKHVWDPNLSCRCNVSYPISSIMFLNGIDDTENEIELSSLSVKDSFIRLCSSLRFPQLYYGAPSPAYISSLYLLSQNVKGVVFTYKRAFESLRNQVECLKDALSV